MPTLIVAEKPSVGNDIAKVLGARQRGQGFVQGGGYVVTWCVGHLVELDEPQSYRAEWKRWAMDTLPMLPEDFRLRPVERTRDQYETVRSLMARPDISVVVNACDAGREGELIFRYVYQLAGCTKPIQRLWISSMTDEAIEDGLRKLQPGANYQRLFDAARCRSEADWLVGLNATRAITVRVRQASGSGELYSVGRVQTPTLALLVQREREIRDFVPQDYFQLVGHFEAGAGGYTGKWFKGKKDRFEKEEDARAVVARVEGKTGTITRVEKKKAVERPPLLFDLTRLQRTANKRYGYSAAQTLEIAQKLYETHKLLTYPRTDSMHLSTDLIPQMGPTLQAVAVGAYAPFARRLLEHPPLPAPKRVFDDAKVSDHHAIIPTPKRPSLDRLTTEEQRIYDLVVRRFIGVFYPDAIFEKTRITTEVEGETFVSHGKVVVEPGWREVAGWKDDEGSKPARKKEEERGEGEEDEEESLGLLPPVSQGDPSRLDRVELQAKKTQPPPRYTEATLLAAMEGAGKLLDDDELAQAMKDSGLGTPATRAAIIETLLARSYIERKGKALVPQEKGMSLIAVVPVESLKSPQLTGEWEARLSRMARGHEAADRFQQDVRAYVVDLIGKIRGAPVEALAAAHAPRPAVIVPEPAEPEEEGGARKRKGRGKAAPARAKVEGALGRCPRCGGAVMEADRTFNCRGEDGASEGCGFRIWREVAGLRLTTELGVTLLTHGRAEGLSGFKSRAGKEFSATLVLMEDGRINFEFEGRRSPSGEGAGSREGSVPAARGGRQEPPPPLDDEPPPPPDEPPPAELGWERPSAPRVHTGVAGFDQVGWTCPICHRGAMIKGKTGWGCSRFREGCHTVVPFEIEGRRMAESEARRLTAEGKVGPLVGFSSPSGGPRWGMLTLELEEGRAVVRFKAMGGG